MLFNSLHFLIFFPSIVFIYFLLPHKYRWVFLLFGSYYFYMSWKPEYIFLILLSTIVDYFVAIYIDKTNDKRKKKKLLVFSLIVNLGLLFSFKYWNFFDESLRSFLDLFTINLQPSTIKWLLPVGISFYTFQTLSYTIDVYRGKIKPEKHFGIFAVYVSFFPQLVAGPIERAKNLLPQFYEKHYFDYVRVTDGLKLMMWGFFKKLVIADRAAYIVNTVFNSPQDFTGLPLMVATLLFSFQMYSDFSGYSDIAIGSAQVLGFKLMDNFRRPYFSKSIAEFWRRWHISLSTWFQDYVFTPLYVKISHNKLFAPLNKKIKHLVVFAIVIIFTEALLGLWHGAKWTFVAFGLYHGIFILFYYLTRKWWDSLPRFMRIGMTFVIVNIGLVLFRANSLSDAYYIIFNLFSDIAFSFSYVVESLHLIFFSRAQLFILFFSILFMECIHLFQEQTRIRQFLNNRPIFVRWSIYFIIITFILVFGEFNEQEFIYFQF